MIFIGGIHGVGKTTLCKVLAEKYKLVSYSASDLIRRYNSNCIGEGKQVRDVVNNQKVLLDAVNKYINKNESALLDGHFTLINKDNSFEFVPIDVFRELKLSAVAVIVDEPIEIINRLKHRDSTNYKVDYIREFQEKEINRAIEVCSTLNIELKIINKNDSQCKLDSFIKKTYSKED